VGVGERGGWVGMGEGVTIYVGNTLLLRSAKGENMEVVDFVVPNISTYKANTKKNDTSKIEKEVRFILGY